MDRKKSTTDALNKFFEKQAKKLEPKKRRKVGQPEKEVEKAVMHWFRENNWSMQVVSAKAQYNPKAGRWVSQAVSAGTVDCIGCTPEGIFAAVELKAPNRRWTFNALKNYRQKEYVREKIESNCFACVVDSVKLLESIYEAWKKCEGDEVKRSYLYSKLP